MVCAKLRCSLRAVGTFVVKVVTVSVVFEFRLELKCYRRAATSSDLHRHLWSDNGKVIFFNNFVLSSRNKILCSVLKNCLKIVRKSRGCRRNIDERCDSKKKPDINLFFFLHFDDRQ